MAELNQKQIENQKEYFNKTVKSWSGTIEEFKWFVINDSVLRMGISDKSKILDVGSGTGVLYEGLRKYEVNKYTALDISEEMLKELLIKYPEAETNCKSFDEKITLPYQNYTHIVIFNSIPHFEKLDVLFDNAVRHLSTSGKLIIAQVKTRQKIKAHHKKIGFDLGREPIPLDETLIKYTEKFGMKLIEIKDDEYFYFSCEKISSK